MYDHGARCAGAERFSQAVGLPTSLLPDVGGSSEVLGRVTPTAAACDRACASARRSSAVARTTRAAPRASASSRRAKRSRAGARRAPCSRRRRSRGSIRGCARTRSVTCVPGMWYLMGVVLSAGGAFAWYRDQLARELAGRATPTRAERGGGGGSRRRRGRDVPAVSPGRAHAASRRVRARGAFLGLSLAHTRAHLDARGARGRLLRAARFAVDSAGARAWRRASCCSPAAARAGRSCAGCRPRSSACRCRTVNREEGPAYGAALLAAVGAGAFPDLARRHGATLHARAARAARPARARRVRSAVRALPRLVSVGASGRRLAR